MQNKLFKGELTDDDYKAEVKGFLLTVEHGDVKKEDIE